MPFESIRLITFDCYGTLVDWENGMLAALRPLLSRDGRDVLDSFRAVRRCRQNQHRIRLLKKYRQLRVDREMIFEVVQRETAVGP